MSATQTTPALRAFAFDHRSQLEDLPGATAGKISAFKTLCLKACLRVADGQAGYGVLCDGRYGQGALTMAQGSALWVARPVEWPGSCPLTLEPDVGADHKGLADWPKDHIVKVLCFAHPDDPKDLWAAQIETVRALYQATKDHGLDFLLEVIPSKSGTLQDDTTARAIQRFFDAGVTPAWWKLEPMETDAAWQLTVETITRNAPDTQGIVVLGLAAEDRALKHSFAVAARHSLVKGFAVGRTIFGATAQAWMLGTMDDAQAIAHMADNYRRLCGYWDTARAAAGKD